MADAQAAAPAVPAGMPPGSGPLAPEELARSKAKGREWSRLSKEGQRKEYPPEVVEARKLKNRERQRRFRERQKAREQEEAARLAEQLRNPRLEEAEAHAVLAHAYGAAAQPPLEPEGQAPGHATPGLADVQLAPVPPQETLSEKRKRLGRERQARFREKKRLRLTGQLPDEGAASSVLPDGHRVLSLAELQRLGAQLAGYYTGLTGGLSQEEHQLVMRFFMDALREELGDEVLQGAYSAEAQAVHAAAHAAQAGYLQPGLDLHALQAAHAQLQQQQHHELREHLAAHEGSHLQHHLHMEQPVEDAPQHGRPQPTQEELAAFHRQLEEQQAALLPGEHQAQEFEPGPFKPEEAHETLPEGHSQHALAVPPEQTQALLYAQAGLEVPLEVLQQYVAAPPPQA